MNLIKDISKQMGNENLHFSFESYAKALSHSLYEGSKNESFVLSISGMWGSGKTTLMKQVAQEFPADAIIINYNPWGSSKRFEVWRSFFVTVVSALKVELEKQYSHLDIDSKKADHEYVKLNGLLAESEQSLYLAFNKEKAGELTIDTGKLYKTGAKLALKFVPWGDTASSITKLFSSNRERSESVEKEAGKSPEFSAKELDNVFGVFKRNVTKEHVAKVESLEQFSKSIKELVANFVSEEKKLLVLIDDIDRCLPEVSLEILEAIKLFLDLPSACYIIASDNSVIQHGLDIRYGVNSNIRADHYMEKMVDLSFSLPTPSNSSFVKFVFEELKDAAFLANNQEIVLQAIGKNPRSWKRLKNRLVLKLNILKNETSKISQKTFTELEYTVLTKLEILLYRWPDFMRKVESFEQLKNLEERLREASKSMRYEKSVIDNLEQHTKQDLSYLQPLESFLEDKDLINAIQSSVVFSDAKLNSAFAVALFSLEINNSIE